jgi:hypothetical protein
MRPPSKMVVRAERFNGNGEPTVRYRRKFAHEPAESCLIPVFVVVPPRLLLLDIAGPLEVLRQANRVQDCVRFEVQYVGPRATLQTSIGHYPLRNKTPAH